jgi:hypothetical protein
MWAVLVIQDAAAAPLPVRLTANLVETCVRFAAGQSLTGAVPATVLSLAESCLKTMALAKLKTLVAGLLLLTGLGIGAAAYATFTTRPMSDLASDEAAPAPAPADRVPDARAEREPLSSPQDLPGVVPLPEPPSVRGILRSTQVADTRRVTLQLPDEASPKREGKEPRLPASRTYRLRADARIIINGVAASFADLQPGMDLSLHLSDDQKLVICVRATSKQ